MELHCSDGVNVGVDVASDQSAQPCEGQRDNFTDTVDEKDADAEPRFKAGEAVQCRTSVGWCYAKVVDVACKCPAGRAMPYKLRVNGKTVLLRRDEDDIIRRPVTNSAWRAAFRKVEEMSSGDFDLPSHIPV